MYYNIGDYIEVYNDVTSESMFFNFLSWDFLFIYSKIPYFPHNISILLPNLLLWRACLVFSIFLFVKDVGSSFLKLLAFFKSCFNRCRKENYVKKWHKKQVCVLIFLLGSGKFWILILFEQKIHRNSFLISTKFKSLV